MTSPNEHHHPGTILLEQVMKPLGVSRNRLARDIDVPVGRISDIVSGKRGITPDTALRLGKYFGMPAEMWMRLQAEHDLLLLRSNGWTDVEQRVRVFSPSDDTSPVEEGSVSAGSAPDEFVEGVFDPRDEPKLAASSDDDIFPAFSTYGPQDLELGAPAEDDIDLDRAPSQASAEAGTNREPEIAAVTPTDANVLERAAVRSQEPVGDHAIGDAGVNSDAPVDEPNRDVQNKDHIAAVLGEVAAATANDPDLSGPAAIFPQGDLGGDVTGETDALLDRPVDPDVLEQTAIFPQEDLGGDATDEATASLDRSVESVADESVDQEQEPAWEHPLNTDRADQPEGAVLNQDHLAAVLGEVAAGVQDAYANPPMESAAAGITDDMSTEDAPGERFDETVADRVDDENVDAPPLEPIVSEDIAFSPAADVASNSVDDMAAETPIQAAPESFEEDRFLDESSDDPSVVDAEVSGAPEFDAVESSADDATAEDEYEAIRALLNAEQLATEDDPSTETSEEQTVEETANAQQDDDPAVSESWAERVEGAFKSETPSADADWTVEQDVAPSVQPTVQAPVVAHGQTATALAVDEDVLLHLAATDDESIETAADGLPSLDIPLPPVPAFSAGRATRPNRPVNPDPTPMTLNVPSGTRSPR